MTTLNVSLQFNFATNGTLQGTVVTVPPSSVPVNGRGPPLRASGPPTTGCASRSSRSRRLRSHVHAHRQRHPMQTSSDTSGSPSGSWPRNQLVVEASHGGHKHPGPHEFATAVGALTGTTSTSRKKVAVFVAPTTTPPSTDPTASTQDVFRMLPELVDEIPGQVHQRRGRLRHRTRAAQRRGDGAQVEHPRQTRSGRPRQRAADPDPRMSRPTGTSYNHRHASGAVLVQRARPPGVPHSRIHRTSIRATARAQAPRSAIAAPRRATANPQTPTARPPA